MLARRTLLPPLTARTPAGKTIRVWNYKQKKNLVVVFLHASCSRCEAFLKSLAGHAAELAHCDALTLVIFAELSGQGLWEKLPAQVIAAADLTGRSQRAYLGDDAFGPAGQEIIGAFVADRYGELYAQWILRCEDALPGVEEILSWLRQIELACEECGVSYWTLDS